jgi:long-chain acyl-CoA synthetase
MRSIQDEEQTKGAINADGWLMTGDIGQWNVNGTLSVIDRKKVCITSLYRL